MIRSEAKRIARLYRAVQANKALLLVALIAAGILLTITLSSPGPLNYFQVSYMSNGTTPLALAGIGETLVILSRGFDLSAGVVLSLANVIVARFIGPDLSSQILIPLAALLAGGLFGAVNGYFIAIKRLQPVVVTLATMFVVSGLNLLIMPSPGGNVPDGFTNFFTGAVIPDLLPAPIIVLVVAMLAWLILKNTPFGSALYASGGNEEAAVAIGFPVARTKFLTYVIAGCFYALGGVFTAASTGTGDPLGGSALTIFIFAAVVIGGTRLGGGAGGCLGTLLAAFILMQIGNLMLVFGVSTEVAPLFEGVVVLLSIGVACLGGGGLSSGKIRSWLKGFTSRAWSGSSNRGNLWRDVPTKARVQTSPAATWLVRNKDAIRLIAPSFALLVVTVVVSLGVLGSAVVSMNYANSILVLTVIIAVLAFGQGVVVMTGGLDLSVGQASTLAAVTLTSLYAAEGGAWNTPAIIVGSIGVGALIGLVNGIGIVAFGIPAIIMTMGLSGILGGLVLLITNGVPAGAVPSVLSSIFATRLLGIAPGGWLLVLLGIAGTLALTRTAFGWRIYAVGANSQVARLSGVKVGRVIIGAYILSGVCAAMAGLLLVGYSGSATLNMGEPYLLPTLAAVFVGGTLATGGRGHYLGIVGGALLLAALGALVTGADLSYAVRQIVFGVVVLAAVLWLEERPA